MKKYRVRTGEWAGSTFNSNIYIINADAYSRAYSGRNTSNVYDFYIYKDAIAEYRPDHWWQPPKRQAVQNSVLIASYHHVCSVEEVLE